MDTTLLTLQQKIKRIPRDTEHERALTSGIKLTFVFRNLFLLADKRAVVY